MERQNPLLKALGDNLAVGAVVSAATADQEAQDRAAERRLQLLGLAITAAAVLVGLMGVKLWR